MIRWFPDFNSALKVRCLGGLVKSDMGMCSSIHAFHTQCALHVAQSMASETKLPRRKQQLQQQEAR